MRQESLFKTICMRFITIIICYHLILQINLAYTKTVCLVQYSESISDFFKAIEYGTNKNDLILIVHKNQVLQIPIRMNFLLKGFLDRHKLYFYPVPSTPTIKECASSNKCFSDLSYYAMKLKPFKEIDDLKQIKAVLILDNRSGILGKDYYENYFIKHNKDWFNQNNFLRYKNNIGLKAYLKI